MSLSKDLLSLIAKSPSLLLSLRSGKIINDIMDSGVANGDDLAYTISQAIDLFEGATDIIALMFNDPGLKADHAASILNSDNISVDKVASILNSDNISADRVASILNSDNISVDRASSILNSDNISVDKTNSILKNNNLSVDKTQSILYKWVDSLEKIGRLIDVLTADASEVTISSDTSLTDGVSRYKSLTVDSGVTLTVGASPGVILAGSLTNNGTIKSGWVKGNGGAPGAPPGKGGDGAGAVIILTGSIPTLGTVDADGHDGESGSTTSVDASGQAGGKGAFWLIGDDLPGKGGYNSNCNEGGYNGGGGGCTGYVSLVGGNGGDSDRTSFNTAEDLLKNLLEPVVDWWLVNVASKTPSTTKSIPELGGSGGGGGADRDGETDSGGGGGGGAEVIIYGDTIGDGTVTAKGGKGGNGGNEGSTDCAGGGGGGGVIYILYHSSVGNITTDVSGGSGGTGDCNGTSGSAGVAKTIQV